MEPLFVPFRPVKTPVKGDVESLREYLDWEARGWRRFDDQFDKAVQAFKNGQSLSGGFDHARAAGLA